MTCTFTPEVLEHMFSLGQKGELSLSNGDKATGDSCEEEGTVFWRAIDSHGREYETEEVPSLRLEGLTIVHYHGTAQP